MGGERREMGKEREGGREMGKEREGGREMGKEREGGREMGKEWGGEREKGAGSETVTYGRRPMQFKTNEW